LQNRLFMLKFQKNNPIIKVVLTIVRNIILNNTENIIV